MKQKYIFFTILGLAGACLLGGCGGPAFSALYRPEPPPLPPDWLALLGEPHWRIEWISPDRGLCSGETDNAGLSLLELDILEGWSSPVTAYPYWPARDIPPGLMRPAGALFPFDVREGRLILSWQGGVEAVFYRAMAVPVQENPGARELTRRPEYFDWPRFRELWAGETLSPEIRADPWLADWPALARRTLESGFDRRRISPRIRGELRLPMPPGETWIGTSPFAEARFWKEGEWVSLETDDGVDAYISDQGILRYTREAWIWLPGN
jgi:hypothetical protein